MTGKRYAVLVGNAQFPSEVNYQVFSSPHNNISELKSVLEDQGVGGFSKVVPLADRTRIDVIDETNKILNCLSNNDLLLFYYSGYAKCDGAGELHLTVSDTVADDFKCTSLSVNHILDVAASSQAGKIILILDFFCCNPVDNFKPISKSQPGSSVEYRLLSTFLESNREAVIVTTFTSNGYQLGLEASGGKHTVFTQHLVEGLRSGEADANRDGYITADELYDYTYSRMEAKSDSVSQPIKYCYNVRDKFVIAQAMTNKNQQNNAVDPSAKSKRTFKSVSSVGAGLIFVLSLCFFLNDRQENTLQSSAGISGTARLDNNDVYIAKYPYENTDSDLINKYKRLRVSANQSDDTGLVADLNVKIATIYRGQGRYAHALRLLRSSLDYYENFQNEQMKVAAIWNVMGVTSRLRGQYNTAIGYHIEAVKVLLEKYVNREYKYGIRSWSNLELAQSSTDEYDKAIEEHEIALEIFLKIYGYRHKDIAITWDNLGVVWRLKGVYDKAIMYHEKALKIQYEIFGEKHPKVAVVLNNLGVAWRLKGKYSKAIEFHEKAQAIWSNGLGKIAQTKAVESLKNTDQALMPEDQIRNLIHYYKANIADNWHNLGLAWKRKNRNDQAIYFYRKATEDFLSINSADHPQIAEVWFHLGIAYFDQGQIKMAISYYNKALFSWEKVYGSKHYKVLKIFSRLQQAKKKTQL